VLSTRKLIPGSPAVDGGWPANLDCPCFPRGPATAHCTSGIVCPGALIPGRNPHLPPHTCAFSDMAQGPVRACPLWACQCA
jgi:hypothetical protein